jgi:hypothetical protein
MPSVKKTETIAIKIPEKTKRLIEAECDKSMRNIQDEVLVLITEGLHTRHFTVKDYV